MECWELDLCGSLPKLEVFSCEHTDKLMPILERFSFSLNLKKGSFGRWRCIRHQVNPHNGVCCVC
jgi:hypothetical protein